jgi:hypothetical protein
MQVWPEPPHSSATYTWQHLCVRLCTTWPDRNRPRSTRIQSAHPTLPTSCRAFFWLVFTQASREKETAIGMRLSHHLAPAMNNVRPASGKSCMFIWLNLTANHEDETPCRCHRQEHWRIQLVWLIDRRLETQRELNCSRTHQNQKLGNVHLQIFTYVTLWCDHLTNFSVKFLYQISSKFINLLSCCLTRTYKDCSFYAIIKSYMYTTLWTPGSNRSGSVWNRSASIPSPAQCHFRNEMISPLVSIVDGIIGFELRATERRWFISGFIRATNRFRDIQLLHL